MTDHYKVLGVEPGARQEEIQAAFEGLLSSRKASRRSTSDLHVAHAVLADVGLRRAYDLLRLGQTAGEKLAEAKDSTIEIARDAIPDIEWAEVRRNAWQTALKATVLVTGATAKAADVTGAVSRRLQARAAKQLVRSYPSESAALEETASSSASSDRSAR